MSRKVRTGNPKMVKLNKNSQNLKLYKPHAQPLRFGSNNEEGSIAIELVGQVQISKVPNRA